MTKALECPLAAMCTAVACAIVFLNGTNVCAQATPLIAFLSGTDVGATPHQPRTRPAIVLRRSAINTTLRFASSDLKVQCWSYTPKKNVLKLHAIVC